VLKGEQTDPEMGNR